MAQTTEQESLGALGRQIADDAARLVRSEIELLKAEMRQTLLRMAVGIGLLVGAGLALLLTLIFALGAFPTYFGRSFFGEGSEWKGWGMVAVVLLLIAALLAGLGLRLVLRAVRTGKEAAEGIKEDVAWVTRLPKRSDRSS